MSRHEGVSCDSCLKGNFRGKRYKCLICYDYDLCATCYEAGATTTRHTTQHPMQCILTRADFDLYYGGETISVEQPQSFTCPYCGKMGFIEQTLQEHVAADHNDSSYEVVCPVCAALPGGDPNQVTDDFAAHLSLEHRAPRDLISFVDEPSGSRHVRRIPHPGRGVGGTRARRANMHFSTSGGLASLSPSNRDSMDPIAELLSQLSGVRRSTATSQSNASSQLQQLQMQLQLERQQAQAARQQLERLPRRQPQPGVPSSGVTTQPAVVEAPTAAPSANSGSNTTSQFLLSRCTENRLSEKALQELEVEQADRSLFIQEFLVHTLADNLNVAEEEPPGTSLGVASSLRRGGGGEEAAASSNAATSSSAPASASPSSCSTSLASSTSQQPRSAASATAVPSSRKAPAGAAAAASKSNTRTTPNRDVAAVPVNIPVGRSVSSTIQMSSGTGTVREVVYSPSAARAPLRSASPSSSRRKIQRHVDSRNQPNEPPPPH